MEQSECEFKDMKPNVLYYPTLSNYPAADMYFLEEINGQKRLCLMQVTRQKGTKNIGISALSRLLHDKIKADPKVPVHIMVIPSPKEFLNMQVSCKFVGSKKPDQKQKEDLDKVNEFKLSWSLVELPLRYKGRVTG
jgi:hypothetical protein